MTSRHDAIVVGSGSGGGVVARRLVDAGLDVLVLEAGPTDEHPAIRDPRRSHDLWGSPVDWNYRTVPQEGAAGRVMSIPRGKVLGGSSSMNGMIYVRGAKADFDHWAYLGNDGWCYEDVLPLFKRSEDHDRGASEYHGAGGPLHILSRYEPNPVHRSIVAAGQEAGLAYNDDPNGDTQEGIGFLHLTIKDGRRQSVAETFVRPVLGEDNMHLRLGATVVRLLFAGTTCKGVEYLLDGQVRRATTDGEVVLSAGAIETPKLLMLSGVGASGELAGLGIECVSDLPGVGRGLQDHPICPVIFGATRELPAGVPGLPEMQSQFFWKSRPGIPTPDIQPLHFTTPHYAPWMEGPADAYTLNVGAIRPASRGSVRISSADPSAPPLVDPGFLREEADLDAMVAGIELCREIGRQPALAEWTTGELFPGPGLKARDELREYVRNAVTTYHHPAGSCAMGVDESAVVDPQLRVRGVSGLRVADASVMPGVTSGNTHAPTVMIGERAADLLIESLAGTEAVEALS